MVEDEINAVIVCVEPSKCWVRVGSIRAFEGIGFSTLVLNRLVINC